MNSIIIQTEIKSIEEELKIIKLRMLDNSTRLSPKKYLANLKNFFPQSDGLTDISDLEISFKKSRSEKL